jgi:protein subunit release factor B
MNPSPVSPATRDALLRRMERLGIAESDIEERFTRSGGHGGQKINKTSVAVVLVHLPTGTTVRVESARSQALNRFFARRALCDAIAEKLHLEKTARQQAREKIRRQKRRRSAKQKAKMLEEKHRVSEKKALRRKPATDD